MNTKEFATLIRNQRIKAGYNQTEASKLLFLARSTYNHFESGKRMPSTEVIFRIGALYCMDPIQLVSAIIPDEIKEEHPLYFNYFNHGAQSFNQQDLKIVLQFHSLNGEEQDVVTDILNVLCRAHTEIQ